MACIALVGHPVTSAPQNQAAMFFSYIALVNRKRRPTSIWATPNTTASFIFIEFKYLQGKWRQACLDRFNTSLIASAPKGKYWQSSTGVHERKSRFAFQGARAHFARHAKQDPDQRGKVQAHLVPWTFGLV